MKIIISVMMDTVRIELDCEGDSYRAAVLYDDIAERLQAGESVAIGLIKKGEICNGGKT